MDVTDKLMFLRMVYAPCLLWLLATPVRCQQGFNTTAVNRTNPEITPDVAPEVTDGKDKDMEVDDIPSFDRIGRYSLYFIGGICIIMIMFFTIKTKLYVMRRGNQVQGHSSTDPKPIILRPHPPAYISADPPPYTVTTSTHSVNNLHSDVIIRQTPAELQQLNPAALPSSFPSNTTPSSAAALPRSYRSNTVVSPSSVTALPSSYPSNTLVSPSSAAVLPRGYPSNTSLPSYASLYTPNQPGVIITANWGDPGNWSRLPSYSSMLMDVGAEETDGGDRGSVFQEVNRGEAGTTGDTRTAVFTINSII